MEEDDEEDDQETVGGGDHNSTTKKGRVTGTSRRGSQIIDGESRKSSSFKRKSVMGGSLPGSPTIQ